MNEITAEQAAQQETCVLVVSVAGHRGAQTFVCQSLSEASQALRKVIVEEDLCMSDLKKNCGLVVKSFSDRRVLARVSFNGRIWEEAPRVLTLKELTQ